jgi:3-carboxy-cis,cis-muconate cycloisomerase
MTDLFWPGDERAGTLMSEVSLLEAMVTVETAWLAALVGSGLAPSDASVDLTGVVGADDVALVAAQAESGGNPVLPVVRLLRERAGGAAATWLHRGLTSQDVLDTALMLGLRDTLDRVLAELQGQVTAVSGLAEQHVRTAMVGRTLTQHAVPTTFGAVAAGWLDGLVDAAESAAAVRDLLPAQLGGAVGTLASTTELARLRGRPDPETVAAELAAGTASALGLVQRRAWHTSRGPVTRVGDALVSCSDAWGHIATDVAILSRPEIAEVAEPAVEGRGGSSTMPHKQNPVLSVLVRRAALAAPPLAATLHTASAWTGDQRSDGAWHVEWATLRTLARRTVVAAAQTTELVRGLTVDAGRMRATLDAVALEVLAERRSTGELVDPTTHQADTDPATYLGTSRLLVTGASERAGSFLEENR